VRNNKILVHCSAGIGRTGTIISIYNLQLVVINAVKNFLNTQSPEQSKAPMNLMERLQGTKEEPKMSVFGTVRRLREQRYCMVQASSQYEFIYEYMVHWLEE